MFKTLKKVVVLTIWVVNNNERDISLDHFIVALEMDDVHGPPEVINGIPLNVATPLSSVKRCCMSKIEYAWASEHHNYKQQTYAQGTYRCNLLQLFLFWVKYIFWLSINPEFEEITNMTKINDIQESMSTTQ